MDGDFFSNDAGSHIFEKALVHGLHAPIGSLVHMLVEVAKVTVLDSLGYRRSADQNFGCTHSAIAVGSRNQFLGNDCAERVCHSLAKVKLFMGRKHVNDSIHGFVSARSVNGREN